MRELRIGNIYKHFKDKYYIILDIVYDCESNNDEEYKKVDHEKYPDIKQKYRFEEVKIKDDNLKLLQQQLEEHNEFVNASVKVLSKGIKSL